MNIATKPKIVRGCGTRQPAAYLVHQRVDEETGAEIPWNVFVPCPPWEIDTEAIGLGHQGVIIQERRDWTGKGLGIYDIYDRVGSSFYKGPADFISEYARFGLSRLISEVVLRSELFMKLKPGVSRHILVHDRAIIEDDIEMYNQDRMLLQTCPAGLNEHDHTIDDYAMCAALWWEDVEGKPVVNGNYTRKHRRRFPEDDPMFAYDAAFSPLDAEPTYRPGAILVVPYGKIEIPHDETENHRDEKLAALLDQLGGEFTYTITDN